MSAAPDCVSQTFFRRTRKGRVLRVVRERYLRDDIGFGTLHEVGPVRGEEQLESLLSDEHLVKNMKQILVLDTNVVLNQMDLLEQNCPVSAVCY
jgi:exosome complex exonuclease DIS3/RRP44